MKIVLIFLFYNVLFNNIILSQNNEAEKESLKYIIYGAFTLPQGDFKATSGDKAGNSKNGFGASIDISKYYNEKTYFTSSVSFSKNAVDITALEKYFGRNRVTVGDYSTTWGLTGIKLTEEVKSNFTIYGIGQIGILYSIFPDIEIRVPKITQTTIPVFAFGFGIGAGVKINNINLGIKYLSSEPEYEQRTTFENSCATTKVKLPVSLLVIQIGFDLHK